MLACHAAAGRGFSNGGAAANGLSSGGAAAAAHDFSGGTSAAPPPHMAAGGKLGGRLYYGALQQGISGGCVVFRGCVVLGVGGRLSFGCRTYHGAFQQGISGGSVCILWEGVVWGSAVVFVWHV